MLANTVARELAERLSALANDFNNFCNDIQAADGKTEANMRLRMSAVSQANSVGCRLREIQSTLPDLFHDWGNREIYAFDISRPALIED